MLSSKLLKSVACPLSSSIIRSMHSALIVASDGSEDMELVISVDILRRANIQVTIAGLQDADRVTCARGTTIVVDEKLADVANKTYDLVVLPGGQPGSNNFASSSLVGDVLRAHEKAGALIGAICAAPIALQSHKIALDATLTSYPSVRGQLEDAGYKYSEDRVVVSGKLVTSRGPGTAFDFALKLVELLEGQEKSNDIAKAALVKQ
uniref:D-lactate dehydratase n=2 Tax=Steinernema glaseri TaxID=37863 RepID=A0A1I7Z9F7_9BILA